MNLRRAHTALLVAGLLAGLSAGAFAAGGGLDAPASIVYDQYGVPTIIAQTERDVIFLQGYQHAKDRLFQMDQQRHLFSEAMCARLRELVYKLLFAAKNVAGLATRCFARPKARR